MATIVSAALPEVTLASGYTVEVQDANGNAIVTAMRIKVFRVIPDDRTAAKPLLRPGR